MASHPFHWPVVSCSEGRILLYGTLDLSRDENPTVRFSAHDLYMPSAYAATPAFCLQCCCSPHPTQMEKLKISNEESVTLFFRSSKTVCNHLHPLCGWTLRLRINFCHITAKNLQQMGAQVGTASDSEDLRRRMWVEKRFADDANCWLMWCVIFSQNTSRGTLEKVEHCHSLLKELTQLSRESSDVSNCIIVWQLHMCMCTCMYSCEPSCG